MRKPAFREAVWNHPQSHGTPLGTATGRQEISNGPLANDFPVSARCDTLPP
ncbi:hypothetical protein [Microbulbifer halophilus]|uniref:hypothetical protein n=1 Tax=Microbulbifer halophilus TaxID=453963 RepID=UPI003607041E